MATSNYQKYGVPLYGASWVRYAQTRSDPKPDDDLNQPTDQSAADKSQSPPETSAAQNYLVFAGGGGEGRSGIPNAVMLARFDFSSNSLSNEPLFQFGTGSDLPYRLVVHPGTDGLICAMSDSCRLFEWDDVNGNGVHELGLKDSDNVLIKLEGIGQQKSLAFNKEGSVLAVGGEDGNLRVFKWPSMEGIIDEAKAAGKDLDFSSDGKFLVSLGSSGPCRVWDVNSSTVVASLAKGNGEIFGFCRFSHNGQNEVLYVTAMKGQHVFIVTWNTTSWKRMSSKKVARDPVSAFNVSPDGKLLAIGTVQGDIWVVNSKMQIQMTVKKAHLVIVTALSFSHDSRALASVSLDSSARVTIIEEMKKGGINIWIVILFILLAIAAFFVNQKGLISY